MVEGLPGEGAGFEFGHALGAAAFVEDAPVAVVGGTVDEDGGGEAVGIEAGGGIADAGIGAFGEDDAAAGGEALEALFLAVEERGGGSGEGHCPYCIDAGAANLR